MNGKAYWKYQSVMTTATAITTPPICWSSTLHLADIDTTDDGNLAVDYENLAVI
jgi:hypothetical protein